MWQTTAQYLLMLHGGTAMVTLMLLGALVPLHVRRAWHSRRNRLTWPAMLTFNGVLIATSFGLYYAGSEVVRPWISDIHIGLGLCLPGRPAAAPSLPSGHPSNVGDRARIDDF